MAPTIISRLKEIREDLKVLRTITPQDAAFLLDLVESTEHARTLLMNQYQDCVEDAARQLLAAGETAEDHILDAEYLEEFLFYHPQVAYRPLETALVASETQPEDQKRAYDLFTADVTKAIQEIKVRETK
jgi:hypothetical protein